MTSSGSSNDENTNKWVEWLEDGIAKNYINYYDYNEFQYIEHIGSGGFSKVYKATLKSSNTVVALKHFINRNDIHNNDIMKEIINEVNKY